MTNTRPTDATRADHPAIREPARPLAAPPGRVEQLGLFNGPTVITRSRPPAQASLALLVRW